jgi:micrococcal nuclease
LRQKLFLVLTSSLALLAISLFGVSPQAFGDISVDVDKSDRIEIDAQLKNDADEPQTFVYILQVLDSSGFAVFLDWKVGVVSDEGQDIQTSWSPEKKGSYTLQTFLWSDLKSPALLSNILDETRIILNDRNIAICSGSAACYNGIVTDVIDGDTIRTNDDVTIRFALVDTPERGEDGYLEATEFTSRICSVGSEVLVDEDDGQTEGSYGRMIAKVYCADGKLVNEELLKGGHATLYRDFCDVSEFASEDWAQEYGCSEE